MMRLKSGDYVIFLKTPITEHTDLYSFPIEEIQKIYLLFEKEKNRIVAFKIYPNLVLEKNVSLRFSKEFFGGKIIIIRESKVIAFTSKGMSLIK